MYTDFYGLIREPFRTTPDADAIFLSPSHREALGSILYGIKERKGVILVTGEVGVGKTTILRRYLQIAAPLQQKTIHLYNPNVTFERLLITILHQLGVEPVSGEGAEMVGQLHELAMAEHRRGGTVVLVIDEAQCMPVETLEGIRMLTNLETSNEKLIQIVLMGQPELETLLERHELRHVRERIAVRGRILALTKSESFAYIQHRLDQASREQQSIFSTAALGLIVKTARGIPRRLNILCDNALMTGFRQRQPTISRKIAKHVVTEIDGTRAPVFWRSRQALALVATFILVLPVLLYLGLRMDVPWGRFNLTSPDQNPSHQDSTASTRKSSSLWSGTPIGPATPVNAAPISSHDASPQVDNNMGKKSVQADSGRAGASGKEPVSAGSGRAGAIGKEPVLAGSGRPGASGKEPVSAGSGRAGAIGKEPVLADSARAVANEKDSVLTGSRRMGESAVMKTAMSTEIVTSEEAESSETARLLAVLLDSGRVVLGRAQPTINNPRLEDKGFSSSVFETRLRKEFLTRTGHDLRNLAPAAMPERAKPLLVKLAYFMQKAVQDVQPDINKKGIGFKGFIPATFGTKVADSFSKDTGLKLRQIGPPEVDPRNPDNKPDEQERLALLAIQKSHPRVGDHVIEQRLPDKSVRVLLPLFYTKACLGCHGKPKGEVDISGYEKEGFKEGDLGGAISVILPAAKRLSDGEKEG